MPGCCRVFGSQHRLVVDKPHALVDTTHVGATTTGPRADSGAAFGQFWRSKRTRSEEYMDDLHRIHYVTGHYAHLQGLRLLPLSAPFLLAAVERIAGPFVPSGVWALLLATCLAASFRIGRYYARRFGQATAPRWRTGLFTLVASVA